jgi:hypothetical protein
VFLLFRFNQGYRDTAERLPVVANTFSCVGLLHGFKLLDNSAAAENLAELLETPLCNDRTNMQEQSDFSL